MLAKYHVLIFSWNFGMSFLVILETNIFEKKGTVILEVINAVTYLALKWFYLLKTTAKKKKLMQESNFFA